MQLGPSMVTRSAMDPIGFFILAIILFNVVSTVIAGLKRASARSAAKSSDVQSQTRLSQALKSRAATVSQATAARATQMEQIRRALLASAGVPDQRARAGQPASYSATTQPATRTAASVVPPPRAAAQAAAMPPMPSELPALTFDAGTLQATPVLMTLESGTTAFDQLAAPRGALGSQTNAASATTPPARLDLLQGPNSGSKLFIAAAIVGPCAAFRSIGHTPGGW